MLNVHYWLWNPGLAPGFTWRFLPAVLTAPVNTPEVVNTGQYYFQELLTPKITRFLFF